MATKIKNRKNHISGIILIVLAVLVMQIALPVGAYAQPEDPKTTGYVTANGIDYYYEIQGEGEPLLLLHGGLGSTDMFEPLLPTLTQTRQVIGVDLHGHGRTTLGDRPISYLDMGNDLALLLEKLGYEQVDVMGYSMGGGAALRLAIRHPDLIRRLVVVSAGFSHPDGVYPELIPQQKQVNAEMADAMKETPMYQSYKAIAPNPEDFPRLLDRIGELMQKPFDWSEEVKKLEMPIMLVYGDSDMIRPEHMIDFYQLLGGGLKDAGWMREHMSQNRLAILPNLTHYDIFLSPKLVNTALPFLKGENEPGSWADQTGKNEK